LRSETSRVAQIVPPLGRDVFDVLRLVEHHPWFADKFGGFIVAELTCMGVVHIREHAFCVGDADAVVGSVHRSRHGAAMDETCGDRRDQTQ
jgi:hypothetical protein